MIRPLAFCLAFPLAFAALPAASDEFRVYVVEPGGGVSERMTGVTAEGAAVIFGAREVPEGTTGIVLEEGERPRWTNLTREEVDRRHGGDGNPEIVPFPGEEEVVAAGGDGPDVRGGTWRGAMEGAETSGCPAGLADAIRGGAAGTFVDGMTIQLPEGPFVPTSDWGLVDWERDGPGGWSGTMRQDHGGGMAMTIRSRVTVEGRSRISSVSTIDWTGPVIGGCRTVTRVAFEHAG